MDIFRNANTCIIARKSAKLFYKYPHFNVSKKINFIHYDEELKNFNKEIVFDSIIFVITLFFLI